MFWRKWSHEIVEENKKKLWIVKLLHCWVLYLQAINQPKMKFFQDSFKMKRMRFVTRSIVKFIRFPSAHNSVWCQICIVLQNREFSCRFLSNSLIIFFVVRYKESFFFVTFSKFCFQKGQRESLQPPLQQRNGSISVLLKVGKFFVFDT